MRRSRRARKRAVDALPGAPPLEKTVERAIINAAKDLGFDVCKLSQPRASMVTEGLPDLYIRHKVKNWRAFVEVKRPGTGVVAPHQAAWILYERECGGIAFVANSVERFVDQLAKYGFPVEAQ